MQELVFIANDFSIPMALVDFIPVILFGIGIIVLFSCLADKMSKIQFALFSTGSINVFIAGLLKATYKLLYASNVCDFQALTNMFFPVQSIGFLLAGIAIFSYVIKNKKNKALSVAPVLFEGTFLFVGLMCTGLALLEFALCVIAKRLNKISTIILFIVSFVCSLCMGYLSSQDFEKAIFNWIAEIVNICGQGTFLIGVLILKKNGLKNI